MPRKSATANPSTIGPAPRPPFPGIRGVSAYIFTQQRACGDDGAMNFPPHMTEHGFPDPGNRTPHEPVVFLSQHRAEAIFSARLWPATGFNGGGFNAYGGYRPHPNYGHLNSAPDHRTDADFYPGIEGDDLMKAWFTEVAEKCGWKDVQFFGRSVLLVSKLVG